MPTYDYECQACGKVTEFFHSISAAPKKKCPECGKLKLKKQFGSGGGVIFKGSGFYTTDYRSEDYKSRAKADADQGKASSSKSDSSSDSSKSDTKSDSSKSDAKKSDSGSASKASS